MKKKLTAVVLTLILLSGCSNISIRDAYVEIFRPAESEEPVSDTQVMDSLTLPYNINDSLYPYRAQTQMNVVIAPLIYDPLFKLDEELQAQPVVAQSISGSGNAYTVTLRPDCYFSNGDRVRAEDVLYSFNQTRLQPKQYWQLHTEVRSVEVIDESRIVFNVYRRDKNFAGLLSFPIVRSGDNGSEIVGSGRYTFVDDSGRYSLKANSRNSAAPENITEIELMVLPNDESVENALKSGIIDCIYTDLTNPADYNLGTKSFSVNSGNVLYMGFNRTHDILQYAGVRSALNHMINKQLIATDVYYNKAAAAAYPFSPSYYDLPEIQEQSKSSEEFHIELETLGLKLDEATGERKYDDKSVELKILVNEENVFRVNAATYIAKNIGQYGIAVQVEAVPTQTYFSRLASGNFDMFLAEVRIGGNQDISPIISGSSVGIANDAFDSSLLESYYRYCSSEITCEDFLQDFNRYCPVSVIVFRQSGVMVSQSFVGKMVATSQDIFYNIAGW